MVMLTIASLIIGATLGLRCKVFVLVPATALSIAAMAGAGLVHGDSAGSMAIAAALVVTALQMGYLGGTVARLIAAQGNVPGAAPMHGSAG